MQWLSYLRATWPSLSLYLHASSEKVVMVGDEMEGGGKPELEFTQSPSLGNSSGGEMNGEGAGRGELWAEVKRQLWLAGPLIATALLHNILQMISLMFVGHLGGLPLSGASMATSFAGVTGFSLLVGMTSALDTLCGQAYGAKQYHILGIHMQRAMLVLMLVSVPIAFIWACTGQILKFLGQDPQISEEAGFYARWLIPGLLAFGLLHCHLRFLMTQSNVFPLMLCSGFTALFHALMCWILVFKSGLGSKGAAMAIDISYWINALLLAIYVRLSPACRKTWMGFSREAFHDVFSFVKLAVPSALMVCLEFWSFEMVVLLSGRLPNPKLETSVLSISLNTISMLFMVPFGLGAAVSTRVSNELGAGHPWAARLAVFVVVSMAATEGLLLGLTMFLLRHVWGRVFSNEEEVVNYVAVMMPILAISSFINGIGSVLSGTARGCGWQKIGAVVNLGAYYLVGLPSAVLLAFVFHIGGKGLWIGIVCGLSTQMLLLLIITVRTNWEKEAKKATNRFCNSTIP